MKYMFSVFLTLSFLTLSAPSFADTAKKFQSGIKDVIMSPLQVSDNVKTETANAKFLPFALVGGLLKGSFYMAKKIVTGTVIVVTAPLDSLPTRIVCRSP
jgi:hypothetical protein